MELINQIQQDQIQARKDRKPDLATLLTTLYSEAAMIGKDDGDRETTDDEVTKVLKKFIKNAEVMLDNLEDDSDIRFQNALYEIDILGTYLPEQLSNDRIEHIIADIIGAFDLTSMKDMGVIMKALKVDYEGLFDGAFASKSARHQLTICEQVEKEKR